MVPSEHPVYFMWFIPTLNPLAYSNHMVFNKASSLTMHLLPAVIFNTVSRHLGTMYNNIGSQELKKPYRITTSVSVIVFFFLFSLVYILIDNDDKKDNFLLNC